MSERTESELAELQEQLERVDESLHCCHREAEKDRWIRLSEKRDQILRRMESLK